MQIKNTFIKALQAFIVFFLIFFIFASQASSLTESKNKTDKHFLWAITAHQSTVYVLGSLHIFKPEFYPLPSVIESAYKKSDTAVFEADSKSMESPEAMAFIKKAGFYQQGDSLSKNISAETYSLLQKKLSDAQLPMARFDQLKPWLCALTISVMELARYGYNPEHGIDTYYSHKARRDGKHIGFFETAEFQLNLFSNMSDKMQDLLLNQSLKELDIVNEMATDMIVAWNKGDTAKLSSITTESMKDYPEIYATIFTKRNKQWVKQIENFFQRGKTTFVVVGAGHLVGKGNVIELLRGKGYKAEQR